jgi:hypothetical protein
MTEAFGSTADAARILPSALDTAAVTATTVATTTMTTTATIGIAEFSKAEKLGVQLRK